MKKDKQIMDVSLPVAAAADITVQAARASMETAEYLGILVLTGAYGVNHPLVQAYRNRANLGINGPKTPEEGLGAE